MNFKALYPTISTLLWLLVVPLALLLTGAVVLAVVDLGDMPFDNLDLWWMLAVVPLACLIALYGATRRKRAMRRFASEKLAALLVPGISPGRVALRNGLFLAALVMLAFALLGPRWGIFLQKQVVRGIDIVAAIDVSNSMLATDVAPNRIENAREVIRQQLTERAVFQGAHRLALLVFAGSAQTRLPLTTDHLAFRDKLAGVGVGSVPRGGTSLGAAIEKAADLLERSPEHATKIIMLFTDGEDLEGRGEEVARLAYEKHGIRVFTIGIGDPSSTTGAQVPRSSTDPGKPMLHDGQIVFSRLDVDGLRNISAASDGRYASLNELNRLVDAIAGMRQTELGTEERMRHKPRYQWFLVASLLLIALEIGVSPTRSKVASEIPRVWQKEAA